MDRTIIGARRPLADWLRLQAYGFAWAATGIDQFIPAEYPVTARDLPDDATYEGVDPQAELPADLLALDFLAAGVEMARDAGVPIIIVNEPMFISDGANSDVRYNAFYPRWTYDLYREQLAAFAADQGVALIDVWDAVPPSEFTDSPVHMTAQGVAVLRNVLIDALLTPMD